MKVLFSGEIIEIIPEKKLALKSVSFLDDFIIANSIDIDMNSLIEFYSKEGEILDYKIPDEISGTLGSFSMQDQKLRFSVSSFIEPTRYIDLDLESLDISIIWQDKVKNFNPSEYKKTFTYLRAKMEQWCHSLISTGKTWNSMLKHLFSFMVMVGITFRSDPPSAENTLAGLNLEVW